MTNDVRCKIWRIADKDRLRRITDNDKSVMDKRWLQMTADEDRWPMKRKWRRIALNERRKWTNAEKRRLMTDIFRFPAILVSSSYIFSKTRPYTRQQKHFTDGPVCGSISITSYSVTSSLRKTAVDQKLQQSNTHQLYDKAKECWNQHNELGNDGKGWEILFLLDILSRENEIKIFSFALSKVSFIAAFH